MLLLNPANQLRFGSGAEAPRELPVNRTPVYNMAGSKTAPSKGDAFDVALKNSCFESKEGGHRCKRLKVLRNSRR
jgi:hypothetical protein